ncbi:MAG: formate--tetrahydrofolate ligase [Candidatus Moranbacteria bacterium]|nr:formate--tetrahydrofolate ligase [Candidatus Moranbacteria bacterium]
MLCDIGIAQKTKIRPIKQIAQDIEIRADELELYGNYKAKLKPKLWQRIKKQKQGKLILVTAINPTPAGEGKTTTAIGLSMGLNRLQRKTVLALREPSLGPCFGIKGGACGGGYAQMMPMEDINLHFTGDIHAITSANNLLSALIDNHIYFGNKLGIDPRQVLWKRCLDLNDRNLREVVVGLGGKPQGYPRQDGFNISVASEIMAILCLSSGIQDLKERIRKIVVAYTFEGKPVFAKDLKAQGALTVLLKDALKPNLVQTLENNPVILHGGPFANIAHGCNSILATQYGLRLGDYLVTEAGFGADLGAEKFFNIKCRTAGLKPDAVVLVATIRSLKYNGGVGLDNLEKENPRALKKGAANLEKHIENIKDFGVPSLVVVNHFSFDSPKEVDLLKKIVKKHCVPMALSRVWELGGKGGEEMAGKLIKILQTQKSRFKLTYKISDSIKTKIEKIAKNIYGAKSVKFSQTALSQMQKIEHNRMDKVPVCMAKTQYSFSDNPDLPARPRDFEIEIRELRVSNGAGFIVAIAGQIMTMPGLPKIPAAEKIDVDKDGKVKGLF